MLSRQEGSSPPAAGQVGARAFLGKSLSCEEHLLLLSSAYHSQAELVKTKGDSQETDWRKASSVGSSDSRWE